MTRLISIGKTSFDLDRKPVLMGILNVTPDSFSDGGNYTGVDAAVAHALQMQEDGADIIDIGGESTRPGSRGVSAEEEIRRVIPVIQAVRRQSGICISIDTTKAVVLKEAIAAGADMLNDVSGLTRDPAILDMLREHPVPVIIMHSKGTPDVMQNRPDYEDVVTEVLDFLNRQADLAKNAGVSEIFIDPGIGFGKRLDHNLSIFRNLSAFAATGYPVVIGPSRKSFIQHALALDVNDRLEASLGAAAVSVFCGADVVRMHDVKEARRAIDIAACIRNAEAH